MRTDVTVGRIMEIPLFVENGTIFSGERGLGKPVQFVTVMETPDFNVRTLHRSTMVLTTLSAYYHRLEYVNLIIESLCKQGVAAIVIKLGRYLDEIHESTIEITKGYDTALIAIPNTVLFSRAISDVLSVVNQSQQSFISGLNELTGSLIGNILQNKEFSAILSELTKLIPCCCAVHSSTGTLVQRMASCDLGYNEEDTLELINRSKTDDSGQLKSGGYLKKDSTYLFGCFAHGRILGYLTIVLGDEIDGQTLLFIHQIVSFLSIKFLEKHLQTETEQRTVLPVIDKLLFSPNQDENQARDRMSFLGVIPRDRHIVMLLSSVNETDVSQYSRLEYWKALFAKAFVNCNLFLKGSDYLVLASFKQESRFCNVENIRKVLQGILPLHASGMVLGMGSMCDSFASLSACYEQAKLALRFSRTPCCSLRVDREYPDEGERIHIYDDYLELGMLSHMLRVPEYDVFYKTVILPIMNYNAEREFNLWTTLEKCVDEKSLEKAAKEMFIHISTLRYRLQKIAELTGADFFTPYGRFILTMAVILHRIDQS